MSINYFGIGTADAARVGSLVEGNPDPDVPPIDVAAVRTAMLSCRLKGPANGTLKWESGGSYVFVDVSPTCVLVTHNAGGDDDQLFVVMDITDALNRIGLNVWDPQQGTWFPGSPVKAKKATAKTPAKTKPSSKPKTKPTKQKAAAKTTTKAKAKTKAKPKSKAKAKAKPSRKAKPKPKTKSRR